MIRNKVRHLLVEDPSSHNEVIGIITTTDLARYLQKRMKHAAANREDENEQAATIFFFFSFFFFF